MIKIICMRLVFSGISWTESSRWKNASCCPIHFFLCIWTLIVQIEVKTDRSTPIKNTRPNLTSLTAPRRKNLNMYNYNLTLIHMRDAEQGALLKLYVLDVSTRVQCASSKIVCVRIRLHPCGIFPSVYCFILCRFLFVIQWLVNNEWHRL